MLKRPCNGYRNDVADLDHARRPPPRSHRAFGKRTPLFGHELAGSANSLPQKHDVCTPLFFFLDLTRQDRTSGRFDRRTRKNTRQPGFIPAFATANFVVPRGANEAVQS
jgi:hypothetical protein